MSKKCRAFSKSKLGLEASDNRKAFYAGWDAALAQQPAKWVGLTDEEIDAAVKSCNTTDTYKYFRAIEQALKEKNT